jgi:hypothetical protein
VTADVTGERLQMCCRCELVHVTVTPSAFCVCSKLTSLLILRVFVMLLQAFDFKHFDRILSNLFIEILNCIPAKIKAYHICTGSGKSVADLVLPVLKKMGGKDIRLHLHLHVSQLCIIFSRATCCMRRCFRTNESHFLRLSLFI